MDGEEELFEKAKNLKDVVDNIIRDYKSYTK